MSKNSLHSESGKPFIVILGIIAVIGILVSGWNNHTKSVREVAEVEVTLPMAEVVFYNEYNAERLGEPNFFSEGKIVTPPYVQEDALHKSIVIQIINGSDYENYRIVGIHKNNPDIQMCWDKTSFVEGEILDFYSCNDAALA